MILKQLTLHNIRSYIQETIEFPEGKVLIAGDIGSGKSTILLGIEFALFGIQRGLLSGETILRNGKTSGSVELRFTIGKEDILIHRKLKKQGNSVSQTAGFIIQNDRKYEGTPLELKAKILNILGYPKTMITKAKSLVFRYTVYTPQEEMKQILTEDNEIRMDTLRRVFNVDKYKRIKENALLLLRHLKQEQAVLKGRSEDLEEKEHQVREREQEITELKISANTLAPELKALKEKIKNTKERLDELEKKEQERIRLTEMIDDITQRVRAKVDEHLRLTRKAEIAEEKAKDISNKLKIFSVEKPDEKLLRQLREKLQKERQERYALEQKKLSIKEELASIQKQIDPLIEETKNGLGLQPKLEQLEHNVKTIPENNIEKDEMLMVSEKRLAEQNLENAKALSISISKLTKCPTCKQQVDTNHKEYIIKTEEHKQKLAISTIDSVNKKLNQIRIEKKEFERAKEEQKKLNEEIIRIKGEIIQFESSSRILLSLRKRQSELIEQDRQSKEIRTDETLPKQIQELEEREKKYNEGRLLKTELDGELKNLETIKEQKISIKNEIGQMNSKKAELLEKIKTIETKELLGLRAENDILNVKEKELEMKSATLKQRVKDIQMQLDLLKKEVETKKESRKQMQELSQKQKWVDDLFINLIGVIEKNVMASVHREFSELFSMWFDMLMQDEILHARLDDRFTPVVIQNGYETDITGLSGGEKTSLALAYRLALNKVINHLIGDINTKDIIILDEPTDGFSTHQLDNVRDVLDELANNQIIIVSHEPKVESFVDSIIRVRKQEHVSSLV